MLDQILSENEIRFLDKLLSEVSLLPRNQRNIEAFRKEWSQLVYEGYDDCTEQLRIKGVLDNNWVDFYKVEEEFDIENIYETKVEVCSINVKVLIEYWLNTLLYSAGKSRDEIDISQIKEETNGYSIPVSLGTDTIKLLFVTNDIAHFNGAKNLGSPCISFIGELFLPESKYLNWFDPVLNSFDSTRFFVWLNEQSKPIISKKYSFINLPSDLDNMAKEDINKIVNSFLLYLSYQRKNSPEYFSPESTEYFFPETSIRECFMKENNEGISKIFVVISGSRIEFHTFMNGVKSHDESFSFMISKLQDWIDNKTTVYRKIALKKTSSLSNELIKIVPILIVALTSAISSFNILSSDSLIDNLKSSKYWLIAHITISVISIICLIIVGLIPHLSAWFFSWDRGLEKYVTRIMNNPTNR